MVFFGKEKNNLTFAKVDNDKRMLVSPALIPNKQIFRYDPNTDTYAVISQDTKARSPAYVDITPLRSDSKLVIQSKCHTRMQSAPGCSFGIDYSTNSGGSWTALSGMATRSGTALDFFYKGEALNHHYTSHITTYIDSFTGTRRFSPWGQGWGSGTWELSYGHGEHSITIFEIAT